MIYTHLEYGKDTFGSIPGEYKVNTNMLSSIKITNRLIYYASRELKHLFIYFFTTLLKHQAISSLPNFVIPPTHK